MIGIALIIGFIIYRMYKKGRAITDAYIVASEKALAMIALITGFIYSGKLTEKNLNDVEEDLKHNFEFNDAFKDARKNVLFLYGILYLN